MLAQTLKLGTDQVDLWHLRLAPETADAQTLSPDEKLRAGRFLGADKRIQFVAARAQLRKILSRYLDIAPEAVAFEIGEHGKPRLSHAPGLEFNLSHSGDAGLVGVSRGIRIGVDIEFEKPGRRFAGLAERFFSTPESAALLKLPTGDQPPGFYRGWTCKEAYLKAWGTGLTFPSNRFSVDFLRTQRPRLVTTEMPDDQPGAWQFRVLPCFPGFAAALCHEGPTRWLRHFAPRSG